MHIDLHETTDSDESDSAPRSPHATAKSTSRAKSRWLLLVDDTEHPQPAFQQAVIDAVASHPYRAGGCQGGSSVRPWSRGCDPLPLKNWGCARA